MRDNKILRKIVAALLLSIYLFNIGGQLVLHRYLNYLSHRFYVEQTRKGLYNKNDLTLVKLPVNMPTISDWVDFEDISGCVKFKDVTYNYVKMRLTRTAMYLVCIPDYESTHFAGSNIINASKTAGTRVPHKDHVPFGKMAYLGHFNFSFCSFEFARFGRIIEKNAVQPVQHIPAPHRDIPEQPPKSFC